MNTIKTELNCITHLIMKLKYVIKISISLIIVLIVCVVTAIEDEKNWWEYKCKLSATLY